MGVDAKQASPHQVGYSPVVSMELRAGGTSFDLAAMGPARVVVRDPHPVRPGPATVHLHVDDRETVYRIHLTQGIDPDREDQPYMRVV